MKFRARLPPSATSPTRYLSAGRRNPPLRTLYTESRGAPALVDSFPRTPLLLILSRDSVLLGIRVVMGRWRFAAASPFLTCCRCPDTFSLSPGCHFSSRALLPIRRPRRGR